MRKLLLAFLFVACIPCGSLAADATLRTIDGSTISGPLTAFDSDHFVIADQSVALSRVADLSFTPRSQAVDSGPSAEKIRVLLAGGDRLRGTPGGLNDEKLVVRSGSDPEQRWNVPLESIRAAAFVPTPRPEDWLFRPAADADRLLLANGDTLDGELTDWTADVVTLAIGGGETAVETGRITALLLNPELISVPLPTGLRWQVTLSQGSHLTLTDLIYADDRWSGQTTWGEHITFDASAVSRIARRDDALVPLKEPDAVRYTPAFSEARRLRVDRNTRGGPLRVAGEEFASGWGAHSGMELDVSVPPDADWLCGRVGIDDIAARGGEARLRIEADGAVIWTSEPLRRGNSAQFFAVPVSDRERLTLIVERRGRGGIGGEVDLLDLRFASGE